MTFYPKKKINKKAKFAKKVVLPKATIKAMTKIAQKVVHKDEETKCQSFNSPVVATDPLVLYNSSISVNADAGKLMPTIIQGIDDGMRIGDQVTLQRMNVRGHLILQATTLVNCRIGVRLMVVQPKRYSNYEDIYSNYTLWMPFLLQNGPVSQAFVGNVQDLYLPINRNCVTVMYDKIHYLSTPQLVTATAIGITSNDLYRTIKFFDINLKCKNKTAKYQDANNTPLNYAPVIILGYVHLDGSAYNTFQTDVAMGYTSTVFYEDA